MMCYYLNVQFQGQMINLPRWMIGCRFRAPHSFIFVKQGEKYLWLGTAANLDSVTKKTVTPVESNPRCSE